MEVEKKETIIEATVWNAEFSEVLTFCREKNDEYHYIDMMGVGFRKRINVSLGK